MSCKAEPSPWEMEMGGETRYRAFLPDQIDGLHCGVAPIHHSCHWHQEPVDQTLARLAYLIQINVCCSHSSLPSLLAYLLC